MAELHAVHNSISPYLGSLDRLLNYGLLQANEDPGCVREIDFDSNDGSERYTPQQVSELNRLAKSADIKHQLPKGLHSVNRFDSRKSDLVINFTEDDPDQLSLVLAFLDRFFKLDVNQKFGEKFNIFIAWSTSTQDALKTFKVLSGKLRERLGQAKVLFLNDNMINDGTANCYELKGGDGGEWLTEQVRSSFPEIRDFKTIVQTACGSYSVYDRALWVLHKSDFPDDVDMSKLAEAIEKHFDNEGNYNVLNTNKLSWSKLGPIFDGLSKWLGVNP